MQLSDLPQALLRLRAAAKQGRDPTSADETLLYMLTLCEELAPKRVLEIGAGEGVTALCLLSKTQADYVGIELDAARAERARRNFADFKFEARVHLYEGDAGEILPLLRGTFDLIFLDGPKVQYLRYLPDCKRLLRKGGVLLSDDVLLFGWVTGEPPKKRRMLAVHLREYLSALEQDKELSTQVLSLGEGLAVSYKL